MTTALSTPAGADEPKGPLDERLLELSALFEICQILTGSLTLGAVLENVLRIPMGHFLIDRGVVLLKDPSSSRYTIEGLRGLPREFLHKTLFVPDPPAHPLLLDAFPAEAEWALFFKEFGIRIALPLTASRGILGLVGFGERLGGRAYHEKEVDFLNSLSGIAASAVSNGLMMNEIQEINQRLDRKVQQLSTVFDIVRELNCTLNRRTIGSILSFAVMGEFLASKCEVLLLEKDRLDVLVSKGMPSPAAADPMLLRLTRPERLQEGGPFPDLRAAGIAVLVPMRIHDETRGLLAVGPKLSGQPYSENDLEFLDTLGSQAMASLENARLFEEAIEKQRMEEELRFAQGIQRDLLPQTMPVLDRYEIAAVNHPSREVGGDYYDVIRLSDTRFGISIADVSGKGAGAALLMASLQASLRALACPELPVRDMVGRINNLVFQNTALDKFITFFYGELDTASGSFTTCNAGHNPPLLIRRSGECVPLEKGGLILGMLAHVPYETETVELRPGDRIVLYTDGISEAANGRDEEFGVDRILELVAAHPDVPASETIRMLQTEVGRFLDGAYQNDDMTALVIRVLDTA
jgi:phosphoserine phosphatase RsbU/P